MIGTPSKLLLRTKPSLNDRFGILSFSELYKDFYTTTEFTDNFTSSNAVIKKFEVKRLHRTTIFECQTIEAIYP